MECPCHNCLVLARCRNRNKVNSVNFHLIIKDCPKLQNFLGLICSQEYLDKIYNRKFFLSSSTHFISSLTRFELGRRLRTISKYIPYDRISIRCQDDYPITIERERNDPN